MPRKHTLCASILSWHASSPLLTMHSSRTVLVSGQAQQILHLGFTSSAATAGAEASGILFAVAVVVAARAPVRGGDLGRVAIASVGRDSYRGAGVKGRLVTVDDVGAGPPPCVRSLTKSSAAGATGSSHTLCATGSSGERTWREKCRADPPKARSRAHRHPHRHTGAGAIGTAGRGGRH